MSDYPKVLDETWTFEQHGNACECSSRIVTDKSQSEAVEDYSTIAFLNDGGRAHYMSHRGKLAACAPEMARLLLESEWSGWNEEGYDPCGDVCQFCQANMRDGHAPDCALDTVLRKAGIR